MAPPIYIKSEFELSGQGNGWTEVTSDVLLPFGLDGGRGIRGPMPKDRVASTGVVNLTLNNAASNSAGLQGYYSPDHANALSGFKVGAGARFSIVIDGESIVVWTGRITTIEPTPGQYLRQAVDVECRDYIDQAAKHQISGLAVATSQDEHDAFSAIVGALATQPRAIEVHDGPDTYDYSHDLLRDEGTAALTELYRLAMSSLSLIYVRPDGTLVYEPRNLYRALPDDPVVDITEDDLDVHEPPEIVDIESERVNRVQTIMAPRRESGSTGSEVVMYRANQAISFQAGASAQQFRGLFTDPAQRAFRAGGISLVALVASTDYVFNTAADGSGTDVTSLVDVTATFSGNSVLFAVTNNSGATAYATTLQARGVGVLAQEKVSFPDVDDDSIAEHGENALSIEMPYQSDTDVAREAAQWLLYVLKQERRRPVRIPMKLTGMTYERAKLLARRDISDVFSFAETMTAFSGSEKFFINAIDFEQRADGTVWLYWMPARADNSSFWRLEIVGSSELGQTTRLAFGFIVGHTDVAHADSHSDVAHADVAHDDAHTDDAHADASHGDAGHADSAHGDTAHADSHSDVAHADDAHADTAHADSHSDTAHADVAHSDSAHTDTHSDTGHGDAGGDHNDTHTDTHLDHTDVTHNDKYTDTHDDSIDPHADTPHGDDHDDVPHADSHTDTAHGDGHGDTAHSDSAHADSHTDTHVDTSHVDDAHADTAHTDTGHEDTAHDDSHTDDAHEDDAHSDGHDDTAHGDAN